MNVNTYKTYDKTKNKLRANFEDVKYLITLHLQLLEKIDLLQEKINRLYTLSNTQSITNG